MRKEEMGGVQVTLADNDWSRFANLRLREKNSWVGGWPSLSPSLVAAIHCIWKPPTTTLNRQ